MLQAALSAALVALVVTQSSCPTGQAPDPKGSCIDVLYIEGCSSYQSKNACANCEFSTLYTQLRLRSREWPLRLQPPEQRQLLHGLRS